MATRITDLAESTNITASSFVPIIDNNETVSSKNKKISITDLRKFFYRNSANSSSFTTHTPGFYYFGDNSDGPGNFSGSITTLRTSISASFSSSLDGPAVIKNFSSLFISRSVVISPPRRCKGLLIFVDGDATISGSLRMTGRGASAIGVDASFRTVNPPYLGDYWNAQVFPSSSYLSRVFAVGASGGGASTTGTAGGFGRSGGGGGGGTYSGPFGTSSGGSGGTGTSFSGGAGGGGGDGPGAIGASGSPIGGAGGNGGNSDSGGGAGNPNGSGGSQSSTGTGGLLILIVRGNLKIGPNGSITSNGSAGNSANIVAGNSGGGGSGGGIIYVYYGGTLTNNGSITANGGSGGSPFGGTPAGAGGAGTAIISKLNTAFPVGN